MSPDPQPDWRSLIAHEEKQARLRTTGIAVADVLRTLATTGSIDGVSARYPALTDVEVRACLAFAAHVLAPDLQVVTLEAAANDTATLAPPSFDDGATLAPDNSEPIGERRILVPGYEILGELGRGGMGVVYRARHLKLNRIVALKMILAGEHAGADALARFQREAQAVARLQHPGIVQIYEVGEHAGHSFIALEFVSGGSLASRLTEKPWSPSEAAALVEKIAQAVHVAHKNGIVHRDLKPENVLLTEEDEPKLTDFGLAKRLEETGQTKTGDVMGTPSYMAPEQAAGRKDVGPAADLYALGGILHRLLSGKPPFEGPTTLDVLLRVLEDEPVPLRQLNPTTPRDLETIALKCLNKKPDRRYRSAAELADDLRRFQEGEPIRARHVSWYERAARWTWKHPILAGCRGLGFLFLTGVASLSLFAGRFSSAGGVLIAIVLMMAFLRAPGRRLLWGVLTSVPVGLVCFASAAGIVYVIYPTVFEDAFTKVDGPPNWIAFPFLLAALPAWVGIGIASWCGESRTSMAQTLLRVGLLLVGLALASTNLFVVPLMTLAVVVVGLATRFVRGRWGGNSFDVICGMGTGWLMGGVVGSLVGGCLAGLSSVALLPSGKASMEAYLVVMVVLVYGTSFLLGLAGAALGAIWAARYTAAMSGRSPVSVS